MNLRSDTPLNDTSPDEASGLEEIDRVTYFLRKQLKLMDVSISFQDPPFSERSTTLVLRDAGQSDPVRQMVETELNAHGFSRMSNLLHRDLGDVTLIVSFPFVDTNDGHKNRPAIRIAYQLAR